MYMGAGCFGPKQFRHIVRKHPFLQSLKFGMFVLTLGRIIRTCNVCQRATWAESSVLMLGDIFDLRIIYNFFIISASVFPKLCVISLRIILLFAKNVELFYYFLVNIGGFVLHVLTYAYYLCCLSFHCE